MTDPPYIELHARSAFSFLRGASFPEHLAEQAAELGLPAVALCDRDGVYGCPRFYGKARELGVRAIVGCELTLDDGVVLPVLVATRTGYQNLCHLLTRAKLRGTKEEAPARWEELNEFSEGLIVLTGDEEGPLRRSLAQDDLVGARLALDRLVALFGHPNVYVEVQRHLQRGEEERNAQLVALARSLHLPIVATGGVLYARREQREVLDVFTCIRHHTSLDAAGRLLGPNDERYLRGARAMRALFADLPEAVANTARVGERISFSLENLGYEFPRYPVPEGETMDTFLRKVTMSGARSRYSHLSRRVLAQINRELDLIKKLGFSGYFLIVWDIVNFCTESNILVQGRGSAANSVICYVLGITACDPIACELLFERFLTESRKSWPDIDIDLPSGDRREQVIQEVYRRWGPHGAAMTANVITYKGRSAMREIGKALGLAPDIVGRFSALYGSGDFPHTLELTEQLERSGLPLTHPRAPAAIRLFQRMHGLPRHLGQHSGGMIICQGQLSSIVPLENASMPGRVVAQWDKDDCEDLGIIKVDLLGLGMMAVMQDSIELCAERGDPVDLAAIPKDDAATFALAQRADTIGVFQIESRAQMATLPRLKPACFYDLVVEVAIIRPGPIQGGLMHPYLRRRGGEEPVRYIHEDLIPVLRRTLGVPLFQEQLLQMAMIMADFTGTEAEEVRRALSFHRSHERLEKVCVKLRAAMVAKGHTPEVVKQVLASIQSFAVYGFPESHAISFALLAYASAWLKVHRAPEFYASLLNNQPMGFYAPATLVQDARRHGVRICPVSVLFSDWRCTIEVDGAVRLGFCLVRGLRKEHAGQLVAARTERQFASVADFQRRSGVSRKEAQVLARIGALNHLAAHRRDALWRVAEPCDPEGLELGLDDEKPSPLEPMNDLERAQADFLGTGLTVGKHPMAQLRARLPHAWCAADLAKAASGTVVQVAGQVICRQRPGSAKGFVFVSLEDETGVSNSVLSSEFFEQNRLVVSQEAFLVIEGVVQNNYTVIHIRAHSVTGFSAGRLEVAGSHDFH